MMLDEKNSCWSSVWDSVWTIYAESERPITEAERMLMSMTVYEDEEPEQEELK